jgi:hypothetical protein
MVVLAWAAIAKYHGPRWIFQQKFSSHSSGAWEAQEQGVGWFGSSGLGAGGGEGRSERGERERAIPDGVTYKTLPSWSYLDPLLPEDPISKPHRTEGEGLKIQRRSHSSVHSNGIALCLGPM